MQPVCTVVLWQHPKLGNPRPGTEVSRALRALNPKRVRNESERVSRPGEPQSPQRVRHGVRKESKNAASDSFWTLFGLRGALFQRLWGSPGRDTLSDSFLTLLGFRARRARETSVPGRGGSQTPKYRLPKWMSEACSSGKKKKKSTKINFFGPETAGWGGGLPHEGVGVEKFVPSLESLSSLGFAERNLGMSREFCRDVPEIRASQVDVGSLFSKQKCFSALQSVAGGSRARVSAQPCSLLRHLHPLLEGGPHSCKFDSMAKAGSELDQSLRHRSPKDHQHSTSDRKRGGLRGGWPPFLEIGLFRSFFALLLPFSPFSRALGEHLANQAKRKEKGAFFLRYPRICLSPHLSNPHLWHSKY